MWNHYASAEMTGGALFTTLETRTLLRCTVQLALFGDYSQRTGRKDLRCSCVVSQTSSGRDASTLDLCKMEFRGVRMGKVCTASSGLFAQDCIQFRISLLQPAVGTPVPTMESQPAVGTPGPSMVLGFGLGWLGGSLAFKGYRPLGPRRVFGRAMVCGNVGCDAM